MELEFIRSLADILNDAGLGELEYKQGSDSIVLKTRSNINTIANQLAELNIENINQDKISNKNFESQNNVLGGSSSTTKLGDGDNLNYSLCPDDQVDLSQMKEINSTMIGTFYTSPSPDEPEFAKVGDKIKKGQVVCIIESMKLMNEIKAGFDCEIVEVLVDDQEVVEFGQALFVVKEV